MDKEREIAMNREKAALTGRDYYDQIDALKGFAIFLVVLGHSIILYPIDLHQNSVCDFIFRWLSSVHMPLFFMISGFCFSCREGYRVFIGKKVKRLLIPYFVFNAVDVVPRYLFPSLVNRARGIGESVHKIIFDGGEYWFLYVLFIIFLLYPWMDRMIKNRIYRFAGVLSVLLLLYFMWPSIPVFRVSQVIYYLIYFTVGVMIKRYWGETVFNAGLSGTGNILLIVVSLLLWIVLIGLKVPHTGIITALTGIFTLYLCTRYPLPVRLFRRFGRYSLQLYLFNGYFLVISRTIAVLILGITDPFIIITFNMLVDFILSYLIIKYICGRIKPVRSLMGMS